MKSIVTIYGLAASMLLGGSLSGETDGTREPQPTRTQDQINDQVQHKLAPLVDQLRRLRLDYREAVLTLLEERERLIRQYPISD